MFSFLFDSLSMKGSVSLLIKKKIYIHYFMWKYVIFILLLLKPCFTQVLGWQQVAARIGMQRCAASSQWLNERISLSRYAHVMYLSVNLKNCYAGLDTCTRTNLSNLWAQVPLGNFELDWLIYTADIIFSRALRDQQQVFFISIYFVMPFVSFRHLNF